MDINGIQIDSLLKALRKLVQFKQKLDSDQEKAGAIQAFEYSFELTWKTMKRVLEMRGHIAHSPKEVFRLSALEKMIDDPEIWFDFLKKRNITVHTYNEDEVESVLSVLDQFVEKVDMFIYKNTVRQLNLEDAHRIIVQNILKQYPYSFYVFGSRISGKNQKTLSDLDLCFFDSISHATQQQILSEFEESDLPYTIDLVDWNFCSEDFRKLILNDLVCLHASSTLLQVEDNVFQYAKYLPKELGFEATDGIIHCGLNTSKFNVVFHADPEAVPQNEPWAWWLGPSYQQLKFTLPNHGFKFKAAGYAMVSNSYMPQKLNKDIRQCNNIEDFISVIELDSPQSRQFYEKIQDTSLYPNQTFFVGYDGDSPIAIGILFIREKQASIFGVTTKKSHRRQGWGTQMMIAMMNQAHQEGCNLISLIATSEEGSSIYNTLGFQTVGLFECFERS